MINRGIGRIDQYIASFCKFFQAVSFRDRTVIDHFHYGGKELFGGRAVGVVKIIAAYGRGFEEEDEFDALRQELFALVCGSGILGHGF